MRKILLFTILFVCLFGSASAAFNTTWNTSLTSDGSSNSDQIKLPLVSGGNYNFVVDWGDGTNDTITSWNQAEVTHTYASAGVYNVSISGTIEGWQFNNGGDKLKIIDISQWGDLRTGSYVGIFYGCSNMQTTATDGLNTTGMTTMAYMFRGCSVANPDVSGFDTSQVTDMGHMFRGCSVANPDVSGFDTSKVTNMWSMFYGCSMANPDVSGFDTSQVTNMALMFYGCSVANPDVSGFDTSQVTDMGHMFRGCSVANPDVSGFDTSKVTNMWSMFYGCSMANPDVSGFDTSQVTNMALMFYGCSVANPDVSGFNTSQVTTMDSMFRGCSVANPDVSGFDTSKVTNMAYMFSGATAWSTDNYNKAMLAWGKQNVTSGVVFDSYNRPIYTGLPETRKANLTAQGWTITDSGNTTGTGYFGIAVSTDGGSTWTPVTENTVTLYDNTSAGVQYIATDNVDREVTVRAYYTDNVTVLDETNDGYYYSVNLSHQAGSTVTSGTIIYDTGRPSLTGMEFSSTNPSATYTTEGSLLIISTGALTSGDTYTYSFTLPTYSVSGHIICDENSTSIPGADVVLNGFSATTNETGYFVFPSVTNGTYTITASKYGYYTGEQTISISGDDVENVNITMCQVKPATANETYLPWQIYGIFFAFSTLLVFYAFLHRDFENYTHVLSSFASGALNILLGYSTYIGIVFLNPTTYYYKSEIYAGFHIIWGGVMILLTVIYIIDIGKRTFIEKQVREEYELTGRR